MDSKVLLISNCRFAFLTWTMSLWLRLKRGLFLKRRRCSSDYSIVYFSYTIIPRFLCWTYPVCHVPALSLNPNSCLVLLLLRETLRPSRINTFRPPLPLHLPSRGVLLSPSSSSTSFHTVLLLAAGSICQLLYPSMSRHPPS